MSDESRVSFRHDSGEHVSVPENSPEQVRMDNTDGWTRDVPGDDPSIAEPRSPGRRRGAAAGAQDAADGLPDATAS